MIEAILLSGFATFYITWVLLFPGQDENAGPCPSKRRVVVFIYKDPSTGSVMNYTRPVTLFDWVRRLFGVYSAVKEPASHPDKIVWVVSTDKLPVWLCPTCLGFWVAVVVNFAIMFYTDYDLLFTALNIFCAAGVSRFLFSITNALAAVEEMNGGDNESS
jgi:hypothetical protein